MRYDALPNEQRLDSFEERVEEHLDQISKTLFVSTLVSFMHFVLFVMVMLFLFFVMATPAQGQTLDIASQHRVQNRSDHGVCWWACAQMIGNHAGIVPLQTIVDRVAASGIGFREGASTESIQHWLRTLKLRVESSSGKDLEFLRTMVQRGLPVIATVHNWSSSRDGRHAVLVVSVSGGVETLTDDRTGRKHQDVLVTYIDPNRADVTAATTWAAFSSRWTGTAYAFDPRHQDSSVLAGPPPLREGRLLLDGCFYKTIKADAQNQVLLPAPGGPVVRTLPPTVQLQPVYPHQLPYVTQQPVAHGPAPRIPSNQDIKDGVARPSDVLEYSTFRVAPNHDYHADFRSRTTR